MRGSWRVKKLQDSVAREIRSRWQRAAGEYLGFVRRNRRLSQEDAAGFLGLSRSQVSRIEQGKVGIWFQDLPIYSRLYKISVSKLVTEIERSI